MNSPNLNERRRQKSQRNVMKGPFSTEKHTRLVALSAAFLLLCQNSAFAKCVDDWLAIDEIRDSDSIELLATNNQEFPITYSVRVRSGGYSTGHSRTISKSLDGQETERVVVLPRVEDASDDRLRISCSWTIGNEDAVHDDDHLYRLPYADGMSYRVLQGFGSRFSHRGVEQYAVDFKMSVGTPVHAARGGVVARVVESNNKGCWEDGCGKYANFIVVMHDDGTTGEYYHLQQDGALVDVGERVVEGQKIGLSGNTGHTALPHLHFAVYRATKGARSQSIPINFMSADGVVYQPRRGHHYLAVAYQQAGD
jgi:murein DD-endopeptidase MepM/ murein hydrolase activator NlpD